MDTNKTEEKKPPKVKKRNPVLFFFSWLFRIFFSIILLGIMAIMVVAGCVGGAVVKTLQNSPDIDPTLINSSLNQTTTIVDQNGNLIEQVQAEELRTFVSITEIPNQLKEAFISIEDERFYEHFGVDPIGIVSSMLDNIRAGGITRGASTINQQIVKNVYLSSEKTLSRKIIEAYLSLQIDKALSKDQILEAYLNRINLGQNAYGVQEAARTYFSKDVKDLSLSECALLAGIPKSPSKYAPYQKVRPDAFDANTMQEVGRIELIGEKYVLVYNPTAVSRQRIVLRKMYELGKISYEEYMSALGEDVLTRLKAPERKASGISNYFTDYVKTEVQKELRKKLGVSEDEAQDMLFTGGLKIYATIDVEMQRKLEEIYDNFTEILKGEEKKGAPLLINWSLSRSGNILNSSGDLLFYKKQNLIDDKERLILSKDEYSLSERGLEINTKKLTPYKTHIDITDCYTLNESNNLVTYSIGSIYIPEGQFSSKGGKILITGEFLNNNSDFYTIEDGTLRIPNKFFYMASQGIVQPQSTCVVMDYKGQIKALIGGRDVKGQRILNRATSRRQPGSAIKPISVYYPALNNNFTSASVIEDSPFKEINGKPWPRNFYEGYKGSKTLREAVVVSINTCSVKTLNTIGIAKSMEYLSKMGIIDPLDPQNDDFVSRSENRAVNDENLSSLGLGGMSRGITPLHMTAAYTAIANDGDYLPPISFTKIEDSSGRVILENVSTPVNVSSPAVAYIMKDILRSVIYDGHAKQAIIDGIVSAGKTGTTQNRADIWFVGMTPYYISSVWIGNDNPSISLNTSSPKATELWGVVNKKIHQGLASVPEFKMPLGVVKTNICGVSGRVASSLCSSDPRGNVVHSDLFLENQVPKGVCESHFSAHVCKVSGMPAGEFCPAEDIIQKVFVVRPDDYDPERPTGNEAYYLPQGRCNVHGSDGTLTIGPDGSFMYPSNEPKAPEGIPTEEKPPTRKEYPEIPPDETNVPVGF